MGSWVKKRSWGAFFIPRITEMKFSRRLRGSLKAQFLHPGEKRQTQERKEKLFQIRSFFVFERPCFSQCESEREKREKDRLGLSLKVTRHAMNNRSRWSACPLGVGEDMGGGMGRCGEICCSKQGERAGEAHPAHAPDDFDGVVGRVGLKAEKCWRMSPV